MIFAKDYIMDIENLNKVDVFDEKSIQLFYENVNNGFKILLEKKSSEESLETLFIESLKMPYNYDIEICFTHLEFLMGYFEEKDIDKFQSNEFNLQVIIFYDYLKSINRYSFFHVARVVTYVSDFFLGEVLFKNIIIDLNNINDFSNLDGTSIEYLKMYMKELLSESKTLRTWMTLNNNLCEFLTGQI